MPDTPCAGPHDSGRTCEGCGRELTRAETDPVARLNAEVRRLAYLILALADDPGAVHLVRADELLAEAARIRGAP